VQLRRLERSADVRTDQTGTQGLSHIPRARASPRCAPNCSPSTPSNPRASGGQRRPAPPPLGSDLELGRIDRLIAAASAGQGRTLFVSGPAGIGKTAVLRWLDRRGEERGLRVGIGTAAAIEGAWPFAPVLEALADLSRRHPALLDGLADEYRVEIEGALRGTSPEWAGESRHQRLFVSAAPVKDRHPVFGAGP